MREALASRYILDKEIGRGGMATVYLAEDVRHHRKVAVKILFQEIAGTIGADRFLREIEIAARLTHPNIVPLHDSGAAAGALFYVMPFVEGRSLRELIEERTRLPVNEAVRIASEVADALEYAHAHAVVHRDIKPENILLGSGHPVVTDFGIARAIHEATAERLTGEHLAIGTPRYMSPEQASADARIDGRSDIYSLGCVLYEMITGFGPFDASGAGAKARYGSSSALYWSRNTGSGVPPAVRRAVKRALARDPADRYQSAAAFALALRAPQRRWHRTVVGGAVVLAAMIGGALALGRLRLTPYADASALVPRRVVVAQFNNRTGDRALDYIGIMSADWITEGMLRTGVVDVVPTETALQASRFVESQRLRQPAADPVRLLANESNAGIVVTGSYYPDSGRIQLQVQVSDARNGRLLGAIGPMPSTIAGSIGVIDDIRERVMGLLAASLDPRLGATVGMPMQPPTFDAYREFSEGLDRYTRTDFSDATERFTRAYQRDSTFSVALLMASISASNLRRYEQADSLLSILYRTRSQLIPFYRDWLDYRRSVLLGDRPAALYAIRQLALAAPGTKATYNWGTEALQNGNLLEAQRAFESLSPDRGPMRGWAPYWDAIGTVRHLLGDYARELDAGKRARAIDPDRPYALSSSVRALAAMGRVNSVTAVLDAAERMPADPFGVTAGSLALEAALEFRSHGHLKDAKDFAQRSLNWYDAHGADTSKVTAQRWRRAVALYELNRWTEAHAVASALVAEDKSNAEYLGMLGATAARSGSQHEIAVANAQIDQLRGKYGLGAASLAKARIAAILGLRNEAVILLRTAFSEGKEYDLWLHRESDFATLRGYPPFEELLRTKDR